MRLPSSLFAVALFFGAAPALALDGARDSATCENRQAGVTPGDRLNACTAILGQGAMAPDQEAMTRINRAWALSQQGRYAEAAADYDRAVALSPRSTIAFNERALLALRTGRLSAALKDYNEALRLAPNAPFSLYGRGLTLRRMGDPAKGDADLAAARRFDGHVDAVFRAIGMAP